MIVLLDAALRHHDTAGHLRLAAKRFIRQKRTAAGDVANDMAFVFELGGSHALIDWRDALVALP